MRETRTRRRRSAALWTGLLLAGAAAAIPAGSASAAATLQPRPTPTAAPTDRTLEMVSPVDKRGQPADVALRIADSEDGGILFKSLGAFADVQSSIGDTFYRARRGPHGWTTIGMQPRLIGRPPLNTESPIFVAADARLDSLIETTGYPFVPGAPDQDPPTRGGTASKVYRVGPDAAVDWLSMDTLPPSGALNETQVVATSADTQRLLLLGLDRNARAGKLYVRDGERTVAVGLYPDGTVPDAGVFPAGSGQPFSDGSLRAPATMSDDGQTVAFQSPNAGGDDLGSDLFLRVDALRPTARTVLVNRSRRAADPPDTTCAAAFIGLAKDGRQLLFSCDGPLTDDAPASGSGLYGYDPVTDDLRYLSPSSSSPVVVGADREVRRVYLTGSGESLSVADDQGERELVPSGVGRVAVSRNGDRLAFLSDQGLDGGYAGTQMYVLDTTDGPDGALTCVSCRDGASSGGEAMFSAGDFGFLPARSGPAESSFTADGSSLFFMSTAALAPGAPDGPASVYEYRDGEVRLLVAGSAQGDARFAGASPGGTDVFVVTARSLVPQDDDAPVLDLYSYRRGAGFAPEPGCAGCEPPAPLDRGGPRPESALGSQQDGRLSTGARSPAPATKPRSKPTIVSRRAIGSKVRVRVRVHGAGTIRITGNGLQRTTRTATRAGTFAVTVRLTAKARRAVAARGRLAVRVRVRLTPKSGPASSAVTTLTIKRTTRKAA